MARSRINVTGGGAAPDVDAVGQLTPITTAITAATTAVTTASTDRAALATARVTASESNATVGTAVTLVQTDITAIGTAITAVQTKVTALATDEGPDMILDVNLATVTSLAVLDAKYQAARFQLQCQGLT
jgi:hypothetical protein